MKWGPHDIVAIGLLAFILLYVVLLFLLVRNGIEIKNSDNNKELMIYIVGVLSGYIGLRNNKNKE